MGDSQWLALIVCPVALLVGISKSYFEGAVSLLVDHFGLTEAAARTVWVCMLLFNAAILAFLCLLVLRG